MENDKDYIRDFAKRIEKLWAKYPNGVPQGEGLPLSHELMYDICKRLLTLEEGH